MTWRQGRCSASGSGTQSIPASAELSRQYATLHPSVYVTGRGAVAPADVVNPVLPVLPMELHSQESRPNFDR